MRNPVLAMALSISLALWGGAAQALDIVQRNNATALWFDGGQGFTNATLQITGPDGFTSNVSAARGLPTFNVQGAGRLQDGLYKYVLTAASANKVKVDSELDNGRGDAAKSEMFEPFSKFGAFRISRGTIVTDSEAMRGSDQDQVN